MIERVAGKEVVAPKMMLERSFGGTYRFRCRYFRGGRNKGCEFE